GAFLYQAEGGIRDRNVTGVQTCALPISKGGVGTVIQTPEERHEPVGKLLPELCTLDCGSINFGNMLYVNPTDWLRKQAKLVKESGVKPELECFDTGRVNFANQLIEEGLIDGDPLYQDRKST